MTNPRNAIVAVTYRCNCRCMMCNIWKRESEQELNPEVFDRLPPSLSSINITGGEPFLRKDLSEIISVIKKRCRNPRIVISTNGLNPVLIEQRLKEIMRIEPRVGVRISVDGIGGVHDSVRGIEGAFKHAMESAEILKKLGIADAGLAFTVLDENVHHLKKVYDLSRDLGFQFAVSIAENSDVYFDTNNIQFTFERDLLRRQLEGIIHDQLQRWNVKDWFRAHFLYGLYDFHKGKSPLTYCSAADDFFFFDPKGNVYICPILDRKLGNLCENSFGEIWNSVATVTARKFAVNCPRQCWMACTATPFIRSRMFRSLMWIITKKISAHMNLTIIKT